LAECFRGQPELLASPVVSGARDANSAGRADGLQSSGYDDALAMEILAVHYDIAKVHANAQVYLKVLGPSFVFYCQLALDDYSTLYCFSDTIECDQHRITCGLPKPAAMAADCWSE